MATTAMGIAGGSTRLAASTAAVSQYAAREPASGSTPDSTISAVATTAKSAGSSRSRRVIRAPAAGSPASCPLGGGALEAEGSRSPSSSRSLRISRSSRTVSPECVAPDLRDVAEQLSRGGVEAKAVAGDRGLHDHGSERMGEDVVQLRGDPGALGPRRSRRCKRSLDARLLGLDAEPPVLVERGSQRHAEPYGPALKIKPKYGLATAGLAAAFAVLTPRASADAALDIVFLALLVPGMLFSGIGSTALGIALLRRGYRPRATA